MPDQPEASRVAPTVHTATTPLTQLFDEERNGDRQAREALLCTFNADLGFFERTVLGVLQAAGARTTVIGDAGMSRPDPRAARNAGTRYVHGVAATDSAFHPKLVIVAGTRRCVVAVGSGNLSTGGWHLNAETWTVATADRQRCPALVAQAAAWLRALAGTCVITPTAVDGLNRTVRWLDELTNVAELVETGHRLVHNLNQPIIDQLPGEAVETLRLYAPFHDRDAAAVRTLVKRYAPDRVILAVQPNCTVIEPKALIRVFDELGVPLIVQRDPDPRYRHGKLVEAVTTTGGRWTLTGSPNLSAAALLKSVPRGGNVELGVLTQPSESLFPPGPIIALTDVPAVSIPRSATAGAGGPAQLIEAIGTTDGLHVTFARPTLEAVRIVASEATDYDTWADLGEVPAGSRTHLFRDVTLPGGCRVRTRWQVNGVTHDGAVIFVIDPVKVKARIGEEHVGKNHNVDSSALLGDPRLLERWMDALVQVNTANRAVALPPAGGGQAAESDGTTNQRSDADPEDWLTYCDDAKARLGSSMFRFALRGPSTAAAATDDADSALLTPSDRLVDDRVPGLDDDDPDTVNDDADPADDRAGSEGAADGSDEPGGSGNAGESVDSGRTLSEHARRRTRRQLRRAAYDAAPHLAAIDRLAIGTLLVVSIGLDIWDHANGDDGWIDVLSTLLTRIDLDDIPAELEADVASFAAVAIYLIWDRLPPTERVSATGRYRAAEGATSHLFAAAEVDSVARHADGLHNSRGFPIDPDEVMRVITMVVQNDPLADVVDAAGTRHPDWKTHRHDGQLIHVHGTFRKPYLAAATILDLADRVGLLGVWATTPEQHWALAVREGKDLFIIGQVNGPIVWRHFRLNSLATATRIGHDSELASRLRVAHGPLTRPIEEAVAVLVRAGIDVADGPPRCF